MTESGPAIYENGAAEAGPWTQLVLKQAFAMLTHDGKRNGTATLVAALNVPDGSGVGQTMQRHRHQKLIGQDFIGLPPICSMWWRVG